MLLGPIRAALAGEGGFTLIEVMIAILLMTIGLLAAAGTFPSLTAGALYGKDQTRAANLAQQQMEVYRNSATSAFAGWVGDYGTQVASQTFDQNGTATTTPGSIYFTRDVQIQYWAWSGAFNAFTPTAPYTAPSGPYVYHIAVTTHWPVRGQTVFVTGTTSGCVSGGSVVPVGLGCVTVSNFVAP